MVGDLTARLISRKEDSASHGSKLGQRAWELNEIEPSKVISGPDTLWGSGGKHLMARKSA